MCSPFPTTHRKYRRSKPEITQKVTITVLSDCQYLYLAAYCQIWDDIYYPIEIRCMVHFYDINTKKQD